MPAFSREVLAAREWLAAEPGAGPDTKADVGSTLLAISRRLREIGKTDDQLCDPPPGRGATGRRGAVVAIVHGSTGRPGLVSVASGSFPFGESGKLDEALVAYRQARAHYEARYSEAGATAEVRYKLAGVIGNMAISLGETGKRPEAAGPVSRGHGNQPKAHRRVPDQRKLP